MGLAFVFSLLMLSLVDPSAHAKSKKKPLMKPHDVKRDIELKRKKPTTLWREP